uniref:Thioredoxin family protein n=1 Tax=Chryseobacterium endophyticum TaxID=1854762 RepID=A0AAU6WVB7_9FLAO
MPAQPFRPLVKFFEGKNEVRIFLRDSDKSLISQFLTNNTESIPKVVILNNDFSVKRFMGPATGIREAAAGEI